jgi:hypothetical protein
MISRILVSDGNAGIGIGSVFGSYSSPNVHACITKQGNYFGIPAQVVAALMQHGDDVAISLLLLSSLCHPGSQYIQASYWCIS